MKEDKDNMIDYKELTEEEKGLRALQYQEYEKHLKAKDKEIERLKEGINGLKIYDRGMLLSQAIDELLKQ
jgi:hemerythrin